MPVQPIATSAKNWASRHRLSSVVAQRLRRMTRTMSDRSLQESGLQRWKAHLELRRSITTCDGSRQGRRKLRSCTSSSASIQRTWSTWQSDWQNKNKSGLHRKNSDDQKMESSAENSLSMVIQNDKNITKMMVRLQKTQ